MKAKVSFDSAKLKQAALAHGEKAALVVGLLVAVYVVWCGLELEGYQRTSKELQSAVTAGRSKLEKSHENPPGGPVRFDITQDKIKVPSPGNTFSEKIDRELISPIDPSRFAGIEYNRPLFETKQRRKEPTFLAVHDLRPAYAYGAVNFKGGEADKGKPVGEEWIAVTGLVPIEEQTAAYTKAFQHALDTTSNAVPVYRSYEIRRAVVKSLDPNEAVEWDKIEPVNLQAAVVDWMAKWEKTGKEQADQNVVSWPPLTEPLPPLTNEDYGPWCVHPSLVAAAASAAPAAPATAAQPAPSPNNPFGLAPQPAPAPEPEKPAEAPAAAPTAPKQLLFRFLDFDVEPGKIYRYQVKLIVQNPNFNLDQAHLEKPELALRETRDTPWSEPSPPLQVPFVDRYYADDVKGAGGDLEPLQTVTVKWWFPHLASEGFIKFEGLMRGAKLSAGDVKISYAAPGTRAAAVANQPFDSGAMLLDFSWERPDARLKGPSDSPRLVNRPAEALILNARGELLIRSQLMDWTRQAADVLAAAPAVVEDGDAAPVQPAQPAGDGGKPVLRLK